MRNVNNEVIKKFNDWIKEGEPKLVKLAAPTKLVVTMKDGGRRFYGFSNEEFFLSGAKMSGQKDIVFDMTPVDSRSFVSVEILDKTACNLIEGFESTVATAMGFREKTTIGRVKGAMRRAIEKDIREEELQNNVANYGTTSEWGIF